MTVALNPVSRDNLAAFIRDQRTIFDFEQLFDAVLELQQMVAELQPYAASVGDIVYSAGTTRAQALPADGAAVSRTTYADLFALIGTTYGVGDGSTTFNVPNIAGRVIVAKEAAETLITNAVSGFSGATLGAKGGSQSHQLVLGEIPSHNHGGTTGSDGAHTHVYNDAMNGGAGNVTGGGTQGQTGVSATTSNGAHTHTITAAGGGGAHKNVQPSIVLNAFILY